MGIDKRPDGSLYITEYTFKEWCESVQLAIQAGYEFSWENRDFPTHYSAPFTAGMKPINMEDHKVVQEQEVAQEHEQQVKPAPKTTRASKKA